MRQLFVEAYFCHTKDTAIQRLAILFHYSRSYAEIRAFFKNWRSIRYTHAHQVPHAEHMEMAKLEALARRRRAVLRLSVHESASEVNRSGGDAQVVSCHHYDVILLSFTLLLSS